MTKNGHQINYLKSAAAEASVPAPGLTALVQEKAVEQMLPHASRSLLVGWFANWNHPFRRSRWNLARTCQTIRKFAVIIILSLKSDCKGLWWETKCRNLSAIARILSDIGSLEFTGQRREIKFFN
jgi:hypothetical protein